MSDFEDLAAVSPLPVVNILEPSLPEDGFMIGLPEVCAKHFNGGDACRNHYQLLGLKGAMSPGEAVQCPYGFASVPFKAGNNSLAVTGFIPFPRLGGTAERANAKRFPSKKLDLQAVNTVINGLAGALAAVKRVEDDTVQRHSAALHEIRKLNAKIKQNAERLSQDIGEARKDARLTERALRIWQASELMSKQFDVMEILANHDLTTLPLKSLIEPYKIFHKVSKVYEDPDQRNPVVLKANPGYHPRIHASDKTFPIIPTVLIHNAEKYASPGSDIKVYIEPQDGYCRIRVENLSRGQQLLENSIFRQGVRASDDTDGSGNGLYVAQMVAKQHGTRISVRSELIDTQTVRHTFEIVFEVADNFAT